MITRAITWSVEYFCRIWILGLNVWKWFRLALNCFTNSAAPTECCIMIDGEWWNQVVGSVLISIDAKLMIWPAWYSYGPRMDGPRKHRTWSIHAVENMLDHSRWERMIDRWTKNTGREMLNRFLKFVSKPVSAQNLVNVNKCADRLNALRCELWYHLCHNHLCIIFVSFVYHLRIVSAFSSPPVV